MSLSFKSHDKPVNVACLLGVAFDGQQPLVGAEYGLL
jgi:hypothetical protein